MMMAILMLMAVIMMMMMINENSYSHNSPFEGKVHHYRLPSNPGLIFYIIHLHVRQCHVDPSPHPPPPTGIQFLYRLGLKMGVHFLPNLVSNRDGFPENYGKVYTYLSFQLKMNTKERVLYQFEMGFKKSF